MAKSKVRFKKDAIVKLSKKLHKVICCDSDTAVLAPTSKKRDGGYKTVFKDMVAVSNVVGMDDLEFEIIK